VAAADFLDAVTAEGESPVSDYVDVVAAAVADHDDVEVVADSVVAAVVAVGSGAEAAVADVGAGGADVAAIALAAPAANAVATAPMGVLAVAVVALAGEIVDFADALLAVADFPDSAAAAGRDVAGLAAGRRANTSACVWDAAAAGSHHAAATPQASGKRMQAPGTGPVCVAVAVPRGKTTHTQAQEHPCSS